MLTISVADLQHNRLPAAYDHTPYCLYRIRAGATVLYVGKAERQSVLERLRQHLALDGDGDFFSQVAGPSAPGHYIHMYAPASESWQVDLLTLADVQAWAAPGGRALSLAQAERRLSQRDAPLLNRTNNVRRPSARSDEGPSLRLLPQAGEIFLTSRRSNQHTYDTYRFALLRWQAFGEATGLTSAAQPMPVQQLRAKSLGDFSAWLAASGLKPNSIRTFIASVKQYFFWLRDAGKLPDSFHVEDMLSGLERTASHHTARPSSPRHQADDSIGVLLNYYAELVSTVPIDTPRGRRQRLAYLRNQAILQTLYSTAGRAGEVAALTQKQIHDAWAVHPGEQPMLPVKISGRGGQERMIYLSLEAQAAVRVYLQARQNAAPAKVSDVSDAPPLFVRHDRDHTAPISTKTVWQVVNEAAKAAFGVIAETGVYRRVGPHQFRHLRAQHLQAAGMPLESLQAVLGHASLLTTRKAYGRPPRPEQLAQELATYSRSASDVAQGLRAG